MAHALSSNNREAADIVECSVCTDDARRPYIIVIDNTPVCHACVKQIFINAAEDESNYPPRWADQELKIDQYKHILDEELIKQYRKKTHEYRKKWDDRVYCPTEREGKKCGEYLGGRRDKDKHTRLVSTCKKCSKRTCLACKTQPTSRSGHVCDPSTEEQEQEAASFKGLTKGKDWQKCPNCKRNIELQDGCNHVVCRCGCSLCFVCGQPAKGNSNHWSKSSGGESTCPRYNHPNDDNAMWEGEADPAGRGFGVPIDMFEDPAVRAVAQPDEVFADLGARRNAIVHAMIVPEQRVQRAHPPQHRATLRHGSAARGPLFNPIPPPSQAEAAGNVAQDRRLAGRMAERGVETPGDPVEFGAAATARRRPAVIREPARLPLHGTDFVDLGIDPSIRNAVTRSPRPNIPQSPRLSWRVRRLNRDGSLVHDREPAMTEDELQDADRTPRFEFFVPIRHHNGRTANGGNHTTSFGPPPPTHRLPLQPVDRRADALADVLSSLPREEREGPRAVTGPRRAVLPDPAAVQFGRPAAVLQAPQIPERGSSLQHRAGAFSGMRRPAQPAHRESSLNFDFRFPADHGAADAQGDTTMMDG